MSQNSNQRPSGYEIRYPITEPHAISPSELDNFALFRKSCPTIVAGISKLDNLSEPNSHVGGMPRRSYKSF